MVGNQEHFPEHRVLLRVGDRAVKVGPRVPHQFYDGLEVRLEALDNLVPLAGVADSFGLGQYPSGKGGEDVLRVPHEFQDVPLGYPHVFEEVQLKM